MATLVSPSIIAVEKMSCLWPPERSQKEDGLPNFEIRYQPLDNALSSSPAFTQSIPLGGNGTVCLPLLCQNLTLTQDYNLVNSVPMSPFSQICLWFALVPVWLLSCETIFVGHTCYQPQAVTGSNHWSTIAGLCVRASVHGHSSMGPLFYHHHWDICG